MSSRPGAIAAQAWPRLAERIAAETGLWFPDSRLRDLHNGVAAIAAERGTDVPECLQWLLDEPWGQAQLDACARHLTVGETYFFREPRAFELVRRHAIEKLCVPGSAQTLQIWSAGCSTGEEPYSIAMTLSEVLDAAAWKRVRIVATDINPAALEHARQGVYREWSFRGGHEAFRGKYFKKTGRGEYRINERIRAAVRFQQANLASPGTPPVAAADLIFCRNVLMYLSEPQAEAVIARFHRTLVHGGWLITSCTEASHRLFADFRAQLHDDAVFYQKLALVPAPIRQPAAAGRLFQAAAGEAPRPRPAPARAETAARPARRRAQIAATPPKAPAAGPLRGPDLAAADRAIAAAPLRAEPYFQKAQALMEMDEPEAAEAQLRRALYLAPRFPMAHYLLGLLMLRRGRARQGRQHLQTALTELAQLDPEGVVPHSDGFTAAQVVTSVQSLLERDKP